MALEAQLLAVDNALERARRTACEDVCRDPGRPLFGAVDYWHPGANIGFGAAHNQALDKARSEFHLILNPDVELSEDALHRGLIYLQSARDAALVSPAARDADGRALHLCKRYPSVWALALRAFAPAWLRNWFRDYLHRYEARDLCGPGDTVAVEVPLVSGCCMLARTAALREVGGFSPRFFLYFEDFDLCIRLRPAGRIAHLPSMRIVHHGGYAARKGFRHIAMFVRAGWSFFRAHGWRWI